MDQWGGRPYIYINIHMTMNMFTRFSERSVSASISTCMFCIRFYVVESRPMYIYVLMFMFTSEFCPHP